jgi:rhodanese-related sulfurtransferase
MIQAGDVILLDVREHYEFEQGHIENTTHIPRGEVKVKVESLLPIKDKEILIYCATGNRSALAGQIMQDLGYTQISSLVGGYVGWKRDSL